MKTTYATNITSENVSYIAFAQYKQGLRKKYSGLYESSQAG